MAKYQLTHLAGKLTVESISRQSLFDADYVGICDNCGKPIVNIATVTDGSKSYDIGLDCKRQLIDKPILQKIEAANDWDAKYKAKEFKAMTRHAEQFLKFASNPANKVQVDFSQNWLQIQDDKPNKHFPDAVIGNTVYSENLGYLYKLGFKGFINELLNNGKAEIY